ncbi:trigger factor-like protein TIG, Chloroplastic [Impatiens glandulifera]|uniref:trigger factor-like protein TIG, Chloroplastic n=1 Tax=Impatiens glandulifera TaxID=253017 RepID=UPI001FB0FAE6|nr:trigger factor-like protein TIG, Chloroplastic [Impatiens glandulifera]
MELCSSATIPALRPLKPTNFSPSSSLFLSGSPLPPKFTCFGTKRICISHTSSSLYRQFPVQLLQPLRTRIRSMAAASPASYNTIEDKLPASLGVTEREEPNSRMRLNVEVPPAVCEDCYKRVLNEFMKQAKIPGFRPGKKVPENVLISYIGQDNIRKATIESILKRTLPHAVSSVTGKALKDSIRIASNFSDMEEAYLNQNSLRYDVIVDVAPEVKWIPEDGYKNLNIVVEIDSDIEADKAAERELRRRYKSLGVLRIVIDRGLQIGDVAILNISATTSGEDESKIETIPAAETKGFNLDTEDGDKLIPGFLDSIIGIKQAESRTFPLIFPESWEEDNLRGVCAQFTVECKELFYRELPTLDDSIADKLLRGCTTLGQVKEAILQKCLEVEQTAKEQITDNAILDQLCKMIEVEVPQSLFEEQGRQFYGAKLLEIQANVKLTEDQLASLSSPRAVKEYLDNQEVNIKNVIKQNLAVGDIFKRENLQFSTDELVKEVENSIEEFKRHKQDYDEDRVKDQVQEILEGSKVLEWLREHADIQYKTR